jgi:hypothetical protein
LLSGIQHKEADTGGTKKPGGNFTPQKLSSQDIRGTRASAFFLMLQEPLHIYCGLTNHESGIKPKNQVSVLEEDSQIIASLSEMEKL